MQGLIDFMIPIVQDVLAGLVLILAGIAIEVFRRRRKQRKLLAQAGHKGSA